jgi:hypothetical protein
MDTNILDMKVGELLGMLLFGAALWIAIFGTWGWISSGESPRQWPDKQFYAYVGAILYWILLGFIIPVKIIF